MAMKDEYLEAESMVDEVSGLIPVVVAKLEPLKWSSFKTSMLKYFSQVEGENGIPSQIFLMPTKLMILKRIMNRG